MTGTVSNAVVVGEQDYLSASGTLTSAQLKTMRTTPVLLVAAPGVNKVMFAIRLTVRSTQGTAAYTGGGAIFVRIGSAGATFNGTIAATVLTTGTAPMVANYYPTFSTAAIETNSINQGLYISNNTAVFATGDGTLQWDLVYSIFERQNR